MAKNLRERVKGYDDVQRREVEVPEWGGEKFLVIGMSGAGRDSFEGSMVVGRGKKRRVVTDDMRAKLVIKTAHDPQTGELVFTDADLPWLTHKSGKALDRLFSAAQEESGISQEDWDELEGNSDAVQSGDSTSS